MERVPAEQLFVDDDKYHYSLDTYGLLGKTAQSVSGR